VGDEQKSGYVAYVGKHMQDVIVVTHPALASAFTLTGAAINNRGNEDCASEMGPIPATPVLA
tara:strand:+ start:66 stop:251 length:186 start_codon:yes stop_codon:yes gene_type:complete